MMFVVDNVFNYFDVLGFEMNLLLLIMYVIDELIKSRKVGGFIV